MAVEVADYRNFGARMAQLGCEIPSGFAVIPANLETATARHDLKIRGEAVTVSKLLRSGGLPVSSFLPSGERLKSIHDKSFHWEAAIFIAGSIITDNPSAISVALSVLANYLTDFFRGSKGANIRLSIVTKRTPTSVYKKLTYDGDATGLASLSDMLSRLDDD